MHDPFATGALARLPLEQVFDLNARGSAELHGHVTTLGPTPLELLVRLDGALSLGDVRGCMSHVGDDQFVAAFKVLWQRDLVAQVRPDRFEAITTQQLHMLQLAAGAVPNSPSSLRKAGFSVGLSWQRPRPAARLRAGPLRAVVVEDDPVLSRMIECFLAIEGFEVCLARDRAGVVSAFRRPQPPDIALLDVTLPDADGFQVLTKLREHPRLRHVPAIMLTGRATREAVLQALAGGADGYLTKPFDPEALMFAVRRAIGLDPLPPDLGGDPWINADARMTREWEDTLPCPLSPPYEPTQPCPLPHH